MPYQSRDLLAYDQPFAPKAAFERLDIQLPLYPPKADEVDGSRSRHLGAKV
jgi:hypothetical protein